MEKVFARLDDPAQEVGGTDRREVKGDHDDEAEP
jgi:hypothetical protein